MNELIAATITIADRSYRIKLNPEDEETVRNTVRIVNEKIIEFKTQFAGKDMQDYIAMVMIWLATEQQAGQKIVAPDKELGNKLNLLEALLDKELKD